MLLKKAKTAIFQSILYSIIATVAVALVVFLIRNDWDVAAAAQEIMSYIK